MTISKLEKKKNSRNLSIFTWSITLLWMFLIITFSSQPAEVSKQASGRILEKVEVVIERVESKVNKELVNKERLHLYIRKNAHVFSYFVLSTLLVIAWMASEVRGYKPYYLAWVMATLFSMLDEYYQTFIPGRSGEIRDVLIDNIGILLGLIMVGIFSRRRVKGEIN